MVIIYCSLKNMDKVLEELTPRTIFKIDEFDGTRNTKVQIFPCKGTSVKLSFDQLQAINKSKLFDINDRTIDEDINNVIHYLDDIRNIIERNDII